MSDVSDRDILQLAADLADRESMADFRRPDLEVQIKPDGSPVSATDQRIERMLRELLAEHRPHDRILGEEEGGETDGSLSAAGGRCWVIDPIDGTESFVAGRRAWSTLLGLEVDGRPVAGVVSMPAVGRRWWGTGRGRRVRRRTRDRVGDSALGECTRRSRVDPLDDGTDARRTPSRRAGTGRPPRRFAARSSQRTSGRRTPH